MKIFNLLHILPRNQHKEYFKRALFVYVLLIAFTSFVAFVNYYQSLMISFYLTLIALSGHFISMFFLYKEEFLVATYVVYVFLGVPVVITSYLEGLMSGYYWFLLDMLFAVPFMVRQEDYFKKHIAILYALTTLMIIIAGFSSPMYSNFYPNIGVEDTHYKLIMNSTLCFILIMLFSILAIITARSFIRKIFYVLFNRFLMFRRRIFLDGNGNFPHLEPACLVRLFVKCCLNTSRRY